LLLLKIKRVILHQEATITVYEGNLEGGDKQTTEDNMVSVFSHEEDHDTNKKSIKAIKERQEGRQNDFDVEAPAYKVGAQVKKEIRENRERKSKP